MAIKKINNKTDKKQSETFDQKGFRFFAAVGRFSVRFRWLVLIFWIVALVLIVNGLPTLSSVTKSDNTSFLPASSPTEKAINLENRFQTAGTVSVPVIIATRDGSQLTSQETAQLPKLVSQLGKTNGVAHVVDRGKSADGQADIVEVQAKILANGPEANITSFIKSLRSDINAAKLSSNLQAHLSGQLAVAVDNSKGSNSQNSSLQAGTVIFIIILLLVIFKAPLAPFITLVPPLIVVTIAGPIIAEAGSHGLKVSSLAQLLLTVLVLGAGTDYGLFLIFRVREEMEDGMNSREAIVKAMSRVGESITFSAATVIAALVSLLLATFQIYSTLGLPLAIGVALMLLAGVTLLPALLAIFGRAVFWPMKPRLSATKKFGLWGRVSSRIVRRPVPVLVIGLIVFGALAAFVGGYQAGGFGGQTNPPSGSDSAEGNALLAKHFPSNTSNPTQVLFVFAKPVWQNPQVLKKAQNLLGHDSEFNHVTGPLNPNGINISPQEYANLYKALGPPQLSGTRPLTAKLRPLPPSVVGLYKLTSAFVSPSGKVVQYSVGLRAGDPASTSAMNAVPEIRNHVAAIAASIGAQDNAVSGEAPAFYDISSISNSDLMRVIPVAVIVIGLLLGLLMRSLVAPLYLVASVVLSYLAALGVSVLIFIQLKGESGIVFILPFLMFIFLLALGEDYNILVMTRIREEAHSMTLKKAVTQALNTTGTTVTSAGLVLAGTFAVLGVVGGSTGSSEIEDIGFGLAIGILMDTFLVRTLLVPSIVTILGRWNWWPSKHGSWTGQDEDVSD
ncbi:MAG TPA: MMPL family transporter [Candidatus Saccharimonadales bacterium]|nr:MMPL family transporter [Candidatus Saccharimonadales bacterium]